MYLSIYIYIYHICFFKIYTVHILYIYIYIYTIWRENKPIENPQSTSSQDPKFCQVVAVDSDFGVFTRAWCMATWMVKEGSFGATLHSSWESKGGP